MHVHNTIAYHATLNYGEVVMGRAKQMRERNVHATLNLNDAPQHLPKQHLIGIECVRVVFASV